MWKDVALAVLARDKYGSQENFKRCKWKYRANKTMSNLHFPLLFHIL